MNELSITINEIPIPASRPRVSRWSTYYNEPYKSYKAFLEQYLSKYMDKDKNPVFSKYEPLIIHIDFHLPMPQSISHKKQLKMELETHVRKPDLDNLAKAILDGMNKTIFADDGQIVYLVLRKYNSFFPRTEIKIVKETNEYKA